ncbi:MAG: hypothetical protein JWP09_886 [Candidatus Taylorbacteria bacterium]|nr:hypothetical protein [Candidatus Taylorbacteria bacterium]
MEISNDQQSTSPQPSQAYSIPESSVSFDFLQSEIKKIAKEAKDAADTIKTDFINLERRQDRANNFMMWMTGIIAGVFLVTGVLIMIDYAYHRGEEYDAFKVQMDSLKGDYYKKDEVDKLFESFKNCIWFNGLSHCLK